mgnify:CR=1 FL=1
MAVRPRLRTSHDPHPAPILPRGRGIFPRAQAEARQRINETALVYLKQHELAASRLPSETFSGPFGSGIRNAPIPPYLIEKYAGEQWSRYEVRQSVSAIDDLIAAGKSEGTHFILTPPSDTAVAGECIRRLRMQ